MQLFDYVHIPLIMVMVLLKYKIFHLNTHIKKDHVNKYNLNVDLKF